MSTLTGVFVIGVPACGLGFNAVIPLTFVSNERPWMLGLPMLVSVGIALLISINILPEAPEWETPLLLRMKIAHVCFFIIATLVGCIGPAIAGARLHIANAELSGFSTVSFYIFAVGILTVAVGQFGRTNGCAIGLLIVVATIILEQTTGWYEIVPDISAQAVVFVPALTFAAAAIFAYRTAGHVQ